MEWRDLDAAGHVNNAVYLSYMESARAAAYLTLTGGKRAQDLDIILARACVDFRSAASFGDTLVIEVRPGRVGQTSFTLTYRVTQRESGELVCEGESVIVCFDYATGTKKPVSGALRRALTS